MRSTNILYIYNILILNFIFYSILGHEIKPIVGPLSLLAPSKFAITALSKVVQDELAVAKERIKVTVSFAFHRFDYLRVAHVKKS